MKINYFTYQLNDEQTGEYLYANVYDLLNDFCDENTDIADRRKENTENGKQLFLAASEKAGVFYLLCPALVKDFKSISKKDGKVSNISAVLSDHSLEKVSYIYVSDSDNFIGITNPLGGARYTDLQYYLNKLIKDRVIDRQLKLKMVPLHSEITKSQVKKLVHISKADIEMNDKSAIAKFFGASKEDAFEELEITISFKRKNGKKNSISNLLNPVLNTIENDEEKKLGAIHLRGRVNSTTENIKDIYLDQSNILYEMIYNDSQVEEQIVKKSFGNQNIVDSLERFLDEYGDTLEHGEISK
ncbi:hypothetical protein CTT31_06460 [Pseudoalteromonas maricaloris]|uniref:hypothetical protein n=1 Tax=Pseudoalteromonas maricaloris TaxID=184924 RepID=UPI0021AE2661|nr:hypothetical protein [Pseudoalteromonas flavipulchra]USE68782.1 hypothetical protein CTT31_06460 [Pseudoalteromonas flavipulchra]